MKFFVFIISILFIVRSFALSENEVSVDGLLLLTAERFNASQDLEGVAKNLIFEEHTRAEILKILGSEKVSKSAVVMVEHTNKALVLNSVRLDFSNFEKGFVSVNGVSVQSKSGKIFSSYLNDVRAALNRKSFLNFLDKAYAAEESDVYSSAMLIASLPESQAKYALCLSRRESIDKNIGKVSQDEFDVLNRDMLVACRETLPIASTVAALALLGDEISSLDCKDGHLSRLVTKNNRIFSVNKNGVVTYLNSKTQEYCNVNFSTSCRKKYWMLGNEECQLNYEDSFVSVPTSAEKRKASCDEEGFKKARVIFGGADKCCSEYPANVVKAVSVSGKPVVTQNVCLANLRVLKDPKGSASKKIKELHRSGKQ